MNNWNCKHCVYFKAGECHRYPPRGKHEISFSMDSDGNCDSSAVPHWPWVNPEDFCGEWKERPMEDK